MKSLLIAVALLSLPMSLRAQTAGIPGDCSYLICALRLDRNDVLAGQAGAEVASYGLFSPPDLESLMAASDSASYYYEIVQNKHRSGAVVGLLGVLSFTAGYVVLERTDQDAVGVSLGTVGLVASFFGGRRVRQARSALSSAVWWYNADLPR